MLYRELARISQFFYKSSTKENMSKVVVVAAPLAIKYLEGYAYEKGRSAAAEECKTEPAEGNKKMKP